MLLGDLYDDPMPDRFIGYSIELDKMDITSFKGILRQYNAGTLSLPERDPQGTVESARGMDGHDDAPSLTRDCSYYEANVMAEVSG